MPLLKMLKNNIALGLLIFLVGCQTVTQQPTRTEGFESGKGFVVTKVVNNAATIGMFFVGWDQLTVADAVGKKFILKPFKGPTHSTQVFAAQLPVGQYHLLELSSSTSGALTLSSNAVFPSKFGTFTVAPETITALGTIVYQPTGDMGYVLIKGAANNEMDEVLQSQFSTLNQLNAGKSLMGWKSGETAVIGSRGTASILQLWVESSGSPAAERLWTQAKTNDDFLTLAKQNTTDINDRRFQVITAITLRSE